jgi:hypothetical protein
MKLATKPDMERPRTIADWNGGEVTKRQAVPVAFGKDRARQVYEECATWAKVASRLSGFATWESHIDCSLTDGERAYVVAVMDAAESGSCTYATTFLAILNDQLEGP